MLAACQGSQSQFGAPPALPQSQAAAKGSGDLLYVGGAQDKHGGKSRGALAVVTFPGGKPVATIALDGYPTGICSDRSGNVWAVVGDGHSWNVYEYAHGGTTPIAKIHVPNAGYYVADCAVDPTTGDLAVVGGAYDGSGATAYVDVWHGAAPGKPERFPFSFSPYACAYDDSGNLFLDGYVGSTIFFELAELAQGSKSVTSVSLDRNAGGYPGGVQWDGTYVDVIAVLRGGSAILRVSVSDYKGHVVGIVRPKGLAYTGWFDIAGKTLVGDSGAGGQSLSLWPYPAGGQPLRKLDHLQMTVRGLTISVGS